MMKLKTRDIAFLFILLYWILISFNDRLIGSSSKSFYVIVAVTWLLFILRLLMQRKYNGLNRKTFSPKTFNQKSFDKTLKAFFLLVIIYIFLSIIQFAKIFQIEGLGFDLHYIPRQAYFIVTFPIAYILSISVDKVFEYNNTKLTMMIMLFIALMISNVGGTYIVGRSLLIGTGSLLYSYKNNIFLKILVVVSCLITLNGQSAPALASLVLIVILFVPDLPAKLIWKNIKFKIISLIIIICLMLLLFFNEIYDFMFVDVNAIWRFQYWINEFKTFVQTFGLGVGYGVAYATDSIYANIFNPNVFVQSGYTRQSILFVVAQHSSIINMFYRLGLIGGALFISLHIKIVQWYLAIYKEVKKMNMSFELKILNWSLANFLYHFVIIALNPGIESTQFFWGYLTFFGILYGVFVKLEELISIREVQLDD